MVLCPLGGGGSGGIDVRVLIDERTTVVDLVMDDHEQVLLGVVSFDLLESEFLGLRHGEGCVCGD